MHHGACMQQAAQREQQDSGSIAVGAVVQQVRTCDSGTMSGPFWSRAANGRRAAGVSGMLALRRILLQDLASRQQQLQLDEGADDNLRLVSGDLERPARSRAISSSSAASDQEGRPVMPSRLRRG